MDASARGDRVVVGLRNGLIVMFNLSFEDANGFIANVEEVELGVNKGFSKVVVIVSHFDDIGHQDI